MFRMLSEQASESFQKKNEDPATKDLTVWFRLHDILVVFALCQVIDLCFGPSLQ